MSSYVTRDSNRKIEKDSSDNYYPLHKTLPAITKEKVNTEDKKPFHTPSHETEFGMTSAALSSFISFVFLLDTLSFLNTLFPSPKEGSPSIMYPHMCTVKHLRDIYESITLLLKKWVDNTTTLLPVTVDTLCFPSHTPDPRGMVKAVLKKRSIARVEKHLDSHQSSESWENLRRDLGRKGLDIDFLLSEDAEVSSLTEIYKRFFQKPDQRGKLGPASLVYTFFSHEKSIRKFERPFKIPAERPFSLSPKCLRPEQEIVFSLNMFLQETLTSSSKQLNSVCSDASKLARRFDLAPGDPKPLTLELALDTLAVLYKEAPSTRKSKGSLRKLLGSLLGRKNSAVCQKKKGAPASPLINLNYLEFVNCFENLLDFVQIKERYLSHESVDRELAGCLQLLGNKTSGLGVRAIFSKLVHNIRCILKMYFEHFSYLSEKTHSCLEETFKEKVKYKFPTIHIVDSSSREDFCIFRKALGSFRSRIFKRRNPLNKRYECTLRGEETDSESNINGEGLERGRLATLGELVHFDKWCKNNASFKSKRSKEKSEHIPLGRRRSNSSRLDWYSGSYQTESPGNECCNVDFKTFINFQNEIRDKALVDEDDVAVVSAFNLGGLVAEETNCNHNRESQNELLEVLRLSEKLEGAERIDSQSNMFFEIRNNMGVRNTNLKRNRRSEEWKMGESDSSG